MQMNNTYVSEEKLMLVVIQFCSHLLDKRALHYTRNYKLQNRMNENTSRKQNCTAIILKHSMVPTTRSQTGLLYTLKHRYPLLLSYQINALASFLYNRLYRQTTDNLSLIHI